ncbi:MAG TPA: prepilin-type N-terminal cleavage/methylation domain-containing protein [Syntrophales bacterium]|nr:prepilin-type N-terminal cleavage/methylation domain-containing protein [Syntrophales bacterium]
MGYKKEARRFRQGGFTLLEIIVTIVIAAIMGVFFAQFVGTSVIHSVDPVYRLQNQSSATHIMEQMTADYKKLAATQSNFLAVFKDYVEYGNTVTKPEGYEGYPYYGAYQKVHNDYIKFVSGVEQPEAVAANQRVLKVTIRRGDQTVTALFTQ